MGFAAAKPPLLRACGVLRYAVRTAPAPRTAQLVVPVRAKASSASTLLPSRGSDAASGDGTVPRGVADGAAPCLLGEAARMRRGIGGTAAPRGLGTTKRD